MTDRDFDVHAYDQGYRDGWHDASARTAAERSEMKATLLAILAISERRKTASFNIITDCIRGVLGI
jgi:hypothetical protein